MLTVLLLSTSVLLTSYRRVDDSERSLKWMQQCLSNSFNSTYGNVKLKKWELSVTEKGFLRLKKYFFNGKHEYFSFSMNRFSDLNYLGTTVSGDLLIKTQTDDIIVQTYNDPTGNIDSMTNVLSIPLIHVEPEMLDSLQNIMQMLKR